MFLVEERLYLNEATTGHGYENLV